MPLTQEVLKISQFDFYILVLINFPFGILKFKAQYGSIPQICRSQFSFKSKLLNLPIF